MYKIVYTKRALKDIELLKRSKSLYIKYEEKEKLISANPYKPDVSDGDFSRMKGCKNLYHIRLNRKHRIFYSIYENSDGTEISIEGIETEGRVEILQAYGHDYESHD